jgi:hypothetical protein
MYSLRSMAEDARELQAVEDSFAELDLNWEVEDDYSRGDNSENNRRGDAGQVDIITEFEAHLAQLSKQEAEDDSRKALEALEKEEEEMYARYVAKEEAEEKHRGECAICANYPMSSCKSGIVNFADSVRGQMSYSSMRQAYCSMRTTAELIQGLGLTPGEVAFVQRLIKSLGAESNHIMTKIIECPNSPEDMLVLSDKRILIRWKGEEVFFNMASSVREPYTNQLERTRDNVTITPLPNGVDHYAISCSNGESVLVRFEEEGIPKFVQMGGLNGPIYTAKERGWYAKAHPHVVYEGHVPRIVESTTRCPERDGLEISCGLNVYSYKKEKKDGETKTFVDIEDINKEIFDQVDFPLAHQGKNFLTTEGIKAYASYVDKYYPQCLLSESRLSLPQITMISGNILRFKRPRPLSHNKLMQKIFRNCRNGFFKDRNFFYDMVANRCSCDLDCLIKTLNFMGIYKVRGGWRYKTVLWLFDTCSRTRWVDAECRCRIRYKVGA